MTKKEMNLKYHNAFIELKEISEIKELLRISQYVYAYLISSKKDPSKFEIVHLTKKSQLNNNLIMSLGFSVEDSNVVPLFLVNKVTKQALPF